MKINVRSPYHIKYQFLDLSYVSVSVHIYEGDVSNSGNAKYLFVKSVNVNTDYAIIEISKLVGDYLEANFDSSYTSLCRWVKVDAQLFDINGASLSSETQTHLAFNGYGYHSEGSRPELSKQLMLNTNLLQVPQGEAFQIPVYAEDIPQITFTPSSTAVAIVDNGNTNQKIQYVTAPANTTSIRIVGIAGTQTIDIEQICEPINTIYKVTFVNKLGAYQDLYFFKKAKAKLGISSENYTANVFDNTSNSYNIHKHQSKKFIINGSEDITINTGWMSELLVPSIEELFLSDAVWISSVNNPAVPVTIDESSVDIKTMQQGLINYSIKFEYAFDKINNVI